MQGSFRWVKPMTLHSFRCLRPNWVMSVADFAPAIMAVAASVNIAGREWRVPRGSRGSGRLRNSSYNDGTAATEAFVSKNLNLLGLRIGIFPMATEDN